MNDLACDPNDQIAIMTAVGHAALAQWPIVVRDVALVKYRENAILRITDQDGAKYALRVHRHGYHTDLALKAELQWMSALEQSGISVPSVIAARDTSMFVKINSADNSEPLQVDMLAWLEGEPIGSIETGFQSPDTELGLLHYQIGRLAAQLHNHASLWEPPQGFERHSWDIEGLLGLKPFWGQFRDLPELSIHLPLIDQACRAASRALTEIGQPSEIYGLIHADLVPENILKNGESLSPIDFDDSGFGWHMFELATVLFFHTERPYYSTIRGALYDGYRSARPLADAQLRQSSLFLYLRSLTYLSWARTRSETLTAKELTPLFVEKAVGFARAYLDESPSI